MASTDKVVIRYGRVGSFGATFAAKYLAGNVTVTASGGTLTFTGASASTGGPFVAGDMVHVAGYTGSDAKLNGTYIATANVTNGVTVSAPAGLVGATASSTAGITVSTLGTLRVRSEDLSGGLELSEDPEVTGTRAASDLILQGLNAGGSVSSSLSLRGMRDLVQAAALESWVYGSASGYGTNGTSAITLSGAKTVTIDDSAKTVTLSSGDDFDGLSADQWVMVKTPANPNGVPVRVVSEAAGVLTYDSASLVEESGTDSGTVVVTVGDYVVEGSTVIPHVIERDYTDIAAGAGGYPRFESMVVNTLQFSGSSSGDTSATIGFLGAQEVSPTPTSKISGTATPRIPGETLSAASHVRAWVNRVSSGCVSDFDFTLNNNLAQRRCVGTLGAAGMDVQAMQLTGSFTRYYTTKDAYDRYLQQTSTPLAFVFNRADGSGALVCDIPRAKLDSAGRPLSGRNQQVFLSASFQSLINDAGTFGMRWWRWAN